MKRWLLVLSGLTALASPVAFAQVASAPDLISAMREPANQLLESFSGGTSGIAAMTGLEAELSYPLDDAERQNWQYWPAIRIGMPVERMTAQQRLWAHDLLAVLLSSAGYLKATSIMQLEDFLLIENRDGLPRSVGHYRLVIFGEPNDADWAWRFEGHHVSLSVSIAGDEMTVTPSFFGANPAQIRTGPLTGLRIHGRLEDLARQLVQSLEGRQRDTAIVADAAPREIFSGLIGVPRERWNEWLTALQPAGVPISELNEMQRHWVQLMLAEIIDNYTDEIAAQYREDIDVSALRFVWMGSTEEGLPHYFRLQGGDFMFEYDNVQRDGNHVHSVWRSKSNDFGRNVLADHYLSATH